MQLWPHQAKATHDVLDASARGVRRVCVASPTGGGKTRIMLELAKAWLESGHRVALYTNRKLLLEQLSDVCEREGICHGIRADGYDDEREYPFQICSLQTEHARCMRSQKWSLHPAELVLVDEAHINANDMASAILASHCGLGAFIVGFTATPLALAGLYDELIQAGTVRELFKCGALVPAVHYAPDEPDRIKGMRDGDDPSEAQQRQAIMRPGLFGRIWDNYERINPEHRPTICFGPDVEGSIWIAQEFAKKGVTASHIDGENVWVEGKFYKSSPQLRSEILGGSRSGGIKVLCNRFVLREGVDCPWLAHGIFACVFGSLQSYLQSGGRLLRAFGGLQSVTIQDHGGNWWRHGSLNEDRFWSLEDSDSGLCRQRAERLRDGKQKEPFQCPRCKRVWMAGRHCNPARGGCGFEFPESLPRSRVVVTEEGDLRQVSGPIFRQRQPYQEPDGPQKWIKMYYRSWHEKRSFRAAAALFAKENDWLWPDPNWPLMPKSEEDMGRVVGTIPLQNLTSVPERTSRE